MLPNIRVVVGPNPYLDLACKSVKGFLKQKLVNVLKYEIDIDTAVTGTKVPYREM